MKRLKMLTGGLVIIMCLLTAQFIALLYAQSIPPGFPPPDGGDDDAPPWAQPPTLPPPDGGNDGNPGAPGRPPSNAPQSPGEVVLTWQADSIISATNLAAQEEKVIFIYFYFNQEKEKFPPNYDKRLQKYSQEQYIFVKVFVATAKDKQGEVFIVDQTTADFFEEYKLPRSPLGVALDPYGNLMDKLRLPVTSSKILPFLDSAAKKFIAIKTDSDSRYENVEKLLKKIDSAPDQSKKSTTLKVLPEVIKLLQGIVKTEYKGYQATIKSYDKLADFNDEATLAYSQLLKDYAGLDKELRRPDLIVPELEEIIKVYKGLPVEQEIKDVIKTLKEGKIPEKILEELEQEK